MGMTDLYVGIAIMLAVSTGLFLIGRRIAILGPRWLTNVLAILTIAGVGAYVVYLRDNMLMAIMLPYSNLVVLGNVIGEHGRTEGSAHTGNIIQILDRNRQTRQPTWT